MSNCPVTRHWRNMKWIKTGRWMMLPGHRNALLIHAVLVWPRTDTLGIRMHD
jgi:hypothetical protein